MTIRDLTKGILMQGNFEIRSYDDSGDEIKNIRLYYCDDLAKEFPQLDGMEDLEILYMYSLGAHDDSWIVIETEEN